MSPPARRWAKPPAGAPSNTSRWTGWWKRRRPPIRRSCICRRRPTPRCPPMRRSAAQRSEARGDMKRASDKVLSWEALEERLVEARAGGRRIVFTNGCFDVLHVGHARYLEDARALGDLLVVG